ncbi:L,D-transpeptidase [Candidatus Margulisiibacteriota bacterium]
MFKRKKARIIAVIVFSVLFIGSWFAARHWEEYKKWKAPIWERTYTIIFTKTPYIPKTILPTPYPYQYDIALTTPNAEVPTGGAKVPPPTGTLSIREAIMYATAILDENVLDSLVDQFNAIAKANDWHDFSAGKYYTVIFKIPRRILLKPKSYKLVINIPDYRVQLYQIYQRKIYLLRTYSCIIGHPLFQTPTGRTQASILYWNPVWIPPKSEWAEKYEKLEAGGINPLGKAGMDFFRVYMIHGTEYPLRQAISHGCVRLNNENISELIWYLQNQYGYSCSLKQMTKQMQYCEEKKTFLWRSLPIELVYEPLSIKDDKFIILKDIYDKEPAYSEKKAFQLLSEHIKPKNIDTAKLNKVLTEGRAWGAEVPLYHLRTIDNPDKTPEILGPPAPKYKQDSFLFFSWKTVDKAASDPLAVNKETFNLVTGNFEPGTMAVNLDAVLASKNVQQRPF